MVPDAQQYLLSLNLETFWLVLSGKRKKSRPPPELKKYAVSCLEWGDRTGHLIALYYQLSTFFVSTPPPLYPIFQYAIIVSP